MGRKNISLALITYRFVPVVVSQVLLETTTNPPYSQSPLLLLSQTFPEPSYFDPSRLSHVYLRGHIRLWQNELCLGKISAVLES